MHTSGDEKVLVHLCWDIVEDHEGHRALRERLFWRQGCQIVTRWYATEGLVWRVGHVGRPQSLSVVSRSVDVCDLWCGCDYWRRGGDDENEVKAASFNGNENEVENAMIGLTTSVLAHTRR